MSRFHHHAGGRRRFKLLRGGLAEAPMTTATDQSWQQFCEHIGWQQLTEPSLPDDYEEQMLARLFGSPPEGENVVQLSAMRAHKQPPADTQNAAGSQALRLRLAGPLAAELQPTGSQATGSRATGSQAADSRAAASQAALSQAAGLRAARWHGAERTAHGLSWLAAVAAAMLLGLVGMTVLSQRGHDRSLTTVPAPVPERAVPERTVPRHVAPEHDTPEHLVKPAPETSPQNEADKPHQGPAPIKIKPPGRHAKHPAVPQARPVKVAVVSTDAEAAAKSEEQRAEGHRIARYGADRAADFGSADFGDSSFRDSGFGAADFGTARFGAGDLRSGHDRASRLRAGIPAEPAALAAIMPSVPPAVAWNERAPSDALWAPRDLASSPPADAAHTPWRAETSWYGVGMTAPREVSGAPAGVRVMAQLDPIEAGRRLFDKL